VTSALPTLPHPPLPDLSPDPSGPGTWYTVAHCVKRSEAAWAHPGRVFAPQAPSPATRAEPVAALEGPESSGVGWMWSRGWQERQESRWWLEMGRQSSLGVPSMAQQGLRDRAERSSVTRSPQRLGPAVPTRGAPALNPGSLCLWTSVSPLQPLPWWEDYVRRSTCRLMLGEGAGVHCGLLAGGAPQHSLHLSALVQLVQEIPEFLFGEGSPESSGGASLDGVAVSSQGESDGGPRCVPQMSSSCRPGPWVELPVNVNARVAGRSPERTWTGERLWPLTFSSGFDPASSTPLWPPSRPALQWRMRPSLLCR